MLVVFVFFLFRVSSAFDEFNSKEIKSSKNVSLARATNDSMEQINEKMGKLFHDLWDLTRSATDSVTEESELKSEFVSPVSEYLDEGRELKLKYKKAELRYFMKTFMIFKVILGVFLPLGIIASKILSWKAVTLSLMAFMLAKILLVKSLLPAMNKSSPPATNFSPPVFIHTSPNDAFWKRQGDLQPQNLWNT